MNALLLAGWLLAAAPAAPDTVVGLRQGDRVVVENLSGSIQVRAWDRSELSYQDDGDGRDLALRRSGSRVTVAASGRKGREADVDLVLRLPPWVALEIRGRRVDVEVTGMAADVQVRTVEGDIVGSDLAGEVTLSTVEGTIEVDGMRGTLSARSRGDDVTVRRATGEVVVESGSGDLELEHIDAPSVRAETLDGDLVFQGAMQRGGTYWFSVHDGDLDLILPPDAGARTKVSTFDGEFTSDFPVTLKGYGGGGVFEFILGDGGASLEIQVFDGEIRLRSAR